MVSIINKCRDLIEDNYKYSSEIQEYYGSSKIFTLQNSNISEASLKVYKNGTPWVDTNYSYDSDTGKVTVTGTLDTGDNLEFGYNTYEKYSDTELKGYIRSALYYITIEKYKTFTAKPNDIIFPTPSESEEDLIAIIAGILIKGSIRSYKTPEFTIVFEEGLSVDKKIKQSVRQFNKSYGHLTYIDPDAESAQDD